MKPLQIAELRSIYEMLSLKGKAALVTGGAGGIEDPVRPDWRKQERILY